MLGAMIVAGPDGFQKSQYRKFNLKETEASDDYGGMREVMKRRFGHAIEDGVTPDDETWPDLVLIDGGKGQLSSVTEVLEDLGITDQLNVVAIAKGPDRNAGREDFYMAGRTPFRLPPNDVGLFYLQRSCTGPFPGDPPPKYAAFNSIRNKGRNKACLDNL